VRDFHLPQAIADPSDATVTALAGVPTRLASLDDRLQERLINWGYTICDTALRAHVDTTLPAGALPYPSVGLDAPATA
jgi:NTE family protein